MDSFTSTDFLLFGGPSSSDENVVFQSESESESSDYTLNLITPDSPLFQSPLSPIQIKTPVTHLTPRTPIQLRTPLTPQSVTPIIYISPNKTPSCFCNKELNESITPITPPHNNSNNTNKVKRKLLDTYEPTDPRERVQFVPPPKRNKTSV